MSRLLAVTYNEGKKINWLNGLKGQMYLFKFRIR